MRPVLLSQIAEWCEGRLLGADVRVASVGSDTRTLGADALFVALRGERVDGHNLLAEAKAGGAVAALVQRPMDSELPQVQCADTESALGDIAAGMQKGRAAVVVALTGSNGKTSVKALTHGILQRAGKTYINPGNRNNEIGLPLAVLDAPEDAEFAIYEMGAGKPGDIAYLAAIAPPQVALVNNIAAAHLERMGSLLGVAETKGAIYEALPDDGVAVVNADDAFEPYFLQRIGRRPVLRFGLENGAELHASGLRLEGEGSHFRLHTPAGDADIALPLPGRHNVLNALAASGLALGAGAPFSAVVEGLQQAQPVPGRQIAHRLREGMTLIDDSYNANPGSVAAAIDTLAASGEPAWLVLGDMKELGENAGELHAQIGELARTRGLSRLYAFGPLSARAAQAFGTGAQHYDSQADLTAALARDLASARPPLRCLVKGSRSSAMDRVVAALLPAQTGGQPHAA